MLYSTRHIANLFEISRETVRAWSAEFAEYLSESAKPGEGRTRRFMDEDVRVFALIAQSKGAGQLFEDIHAALNNGERADPPEEPTALAGDKHRRELMQLQKRIMDLEVQVKQSTEQALASQAEAEKQRALNELLSKQLDEARDEIRELNREIGRLEAQNKSE